VGRIGGDEFAIVLPGVPLEQAFLEMDRLRAAVHELADLLPAQKAYRPSISAGVASYPRDVRRVEDLIARADQALWQAKETGRNQVALPTPEDMILKSNYYTAAQLGRLKKLAEAKKKRESVLLREALDDLLRKYDVK
jgi:predicted signal transduction protein with EAL and GGDEF domain